MELLAYGADWLNLLVRWLHLITGIAWIGASFYFVWLDNSIRPPWPGSELARRGVSGHLWAVHGGGFYNPQKYLVAPAELPPELHWFKWEAYATWLSGVALLVVVYYFNASSMMVDKTVADLSAAQAIGVGVGSLVIGWLFYDGLCRSPLGQRDGLFGVAMFAFVLAAAYVLTHLLSGRAAYIHVGAMIGTMMVGNVLMLIIPGQRKLVEAMQKGGEPDPVHGQKAKQRSVHNNYFTLPVLFIMISNHYAMTYAHRYNWLVLGAVVAAAVLIRHYFNQRHKGQAKLAYPALGGAILLALAVVMSPGPTPVPAAAAPDFARVQTIVGQRCVSCHAAQPSQAGFAAAPAGIRLDTPELLRQNAVKVHQQAVVLKAMPIGNLTNITDEERAAIGSWFAAGAR